MEMEARFKALCEANNPEKRFRAALEWKRQGKKVIGVLSSYVPEEVIYAAGMLPWYVSGTWKADVSLAYAYRQPTSLSYCNHVLQSLLSGELDFLDGLVAVDHDDDNRRLYDVWAYVKKTPWTYILPLPRQDSELAYQEFGKHITRLIGELERLGDVKIDDSSLSRAIGVYNEWRTLLMKVYELRKKEKPPLLGSEVLGLVTASSIMRKEQFNAELRTLLPYLEKRSPECCPEPRLLVSSDFLDNPIYLKLIEDAGSVVAMDDLDRGSRYFWKMVDTSLDPVAMLAKRYITRPACPRMHSWYKQINQIIEWVREFNIRAVLNLVQMYSWPRSFGSPYFMKRMREAAIPAATFSIEYHPTGIGQLRTRFEAFVETLR